MPMYAGMSPRGFPIYLEFGGRPIKVHSRTIQAELPQLWIKERGMIQHRAVSLLDMIEPLDQYEMKALKLLVEYLSEVDHFGLASAAITNGLETIFEKSRGTLGRKYPPDTATFAALGQILSPSAFGCSMRIFKQMESFFLRHSEELLASGEGSLYIEILDELSLNGKRHQWDMSPALSCLARWGPRIPPRLSPKSREIFSILQSQSRVRLNHPHRGALAHRRRPPMLRRPHSHHVGFPPLPSRPMSGSQLCRHELLDLWKNCPEKIVVDPLGPGLEVSHDYDDGYYGHKHWPSSDEEDLAFGICHPRHMLENHAYGPYEDTYLADLRRGRRCGRGRALLHPC